MQRKQVFKYMFFMTFTLALLVTFLAFEPQTASRVAPEQSSLNSVVLVCLWVLTFVAIFTIYREVDQIKLGQIFEALTTGLSSSSLATVLLAVFPQFTGQPLSQYLPYAVPVLIVTALLTSWVKLKMEKAKQQQVGEVKN
ncbi:MAG: hypothetical protein FWC33_03330 [Candidatus Bathyarchaeota archaeon]|nr:hypothetical protein [Candidatus Termiticorpusculum sp.]